MKEIAKFLLANHVNVVLRHALISAMCAIVDFYVFYSLFNFFGINISLSFSVAVLFSAAVGFLGHTFFTFQVNKVLLKNFIYFIIQLTISFIIGFSVFNLFLYFQFEPEMSKIYQLFFTFWFNVIFGKLVSFQKTIKNL